MGISKKNTSFQSIIHSPHRAFRTNLSVYMIYYHSLPLFGHNTFADEIFNTLKE